MSNVHAEATLFQRQHATLCDDSYGLNRPPWAGYGIYSLRLPPDSHAIDALLSEEHQ